MAVEGTLTITAWSEDSLDSSPRKKEKLRIGQECLFTFSLAKHQINLL
jgi:hypothetical protein